LRQIGTAGKHSHLRRKLGGEVARGYVEIAGGVRRAGPDAPQAVLDLYDRANRRIGAALDGVDGPSHAEVRRGWAGATVAREARLPWTVLGPRRHTCLLGAEGLHRLVMDLVDASAEERDPGPDGEEQSPRARVYHHSASSVTAPSMPVREVR
jgi:hypothetical protein